MWRTIKFKRPFDNTIYYLRVSDDFLKDFECNYGHKN